ncbi:hypothetical protein E3N88_16165 [Mikania micrantha]|uniref:Uncharacterized protein n=1 Tax=Mikania micrantha TaxID=192012 RepID=A0A5N6P0S0_9ASTR|nr:hypothetical protein E3N88_16165 [Mikania micrantha]
MRSSEQQVLRSIKKLVVVVRAPTPLTSSLETSSSSKASTMASHGDIVDWAASRTAERVQDPLSVPRWISGLKFSRNSLRTAMGPLESHCVPRWVPEEPNRPNFNGLIRSSSFSRLRTIV